MPKDDQWIKLPAVGGAVYIEALAELLAGQGIPYHVENDWFTTSYGIHGTNAVGNSGHIKVPSEHYEKAYALYQHLIATEWVALPRIFLEAELQPVVDRLMRAVLPFFVQQADIEEDQTTALQDSWQIHVPQQDQSRAMRLIHELKA